MTTNEVKAVLDMVAEKAGLAVDAARPLAEEVVRQYQARALVCAVMSAVVLLVMVILGIWCFRTVRCTASCDDNAGYIIGGVISVATGFGALLALTESLCNYVAPLCGLLGK